MFKVFSFCVVVCRHLSLMSFYVVMSLFVSSRSFVFRPFTCRSFVFSLFHVVICRCLCRSLSFICSLCRCVVCRHLSFVSFVSLCCSMSLCHYVVLCRCVIMLFYVVIFVDYYVVKFRYICRSFTCRCLVLSLNVVMLFYMSSHVVMF